MATQGIFPLDGVKSECWLLRFDKNGECLSPNARAQLFNSLQSSDLGRVILISHGWNNDFADAADLYREFMLQFEALASNSAPTLKTIVVGVIWPSSWAPHDPGPIIAGSAGGASDDPADPARMLLQNLPEVDRQRGDTLLAKPMLDQDEAAELAGHVAAALADEGLDSLREAAEAAPSAADVLEAMRALAAGDGEEPAWDAWTSAPTAVPETDVAIGNPAAAGLFGIDPLMAVRVFTVYQMKDRAGRVGATGVRALLDDLLMQTAHAVHCVGHSYGCKALLSALCSAPAPTRPVESMLLLEPAISHLCFAATVPGRPGPGGYRDALSESHVVQPILSTYSRWDMPLHTIFHLALRRKGDLGELQIAAVGEGTRAGDPPSVYCALGGYGPRGADEALIDPLPEAGEVYALPPGHRIYAFDGTLDKRISGHGDVATDLTAWALLQQMTS